MKEINFSKIYLDRIHLSVLEKFAFENKLIPKADDRNDYYEFVLKHQHFGLRNKLLLIMTIFEEIDSNFSQFDWSKFIDEGIININAHMLRSSPSDIFDPFLEHKTLLGCKKDNRLLYARDTTINLLKSFSNRAILLHIKGHPDSDFYNRDPKKYVTREDLKTNFEWVLDLVAKDDWTTLVCEKPEFSFFYTFLEGLKFNTEECIYYSIKEKASFVNAISSSNLDKSKTIKLLDELYYLVRTNLKDEIQILPHPETFSDVLKFRNSKEIRRFRQILSQWCNAIAEGDYKVEKNIRNDIKRANHELKKLDKWKEYRSSPFNFWLDAIGGQIPIFSNILSAVNTFTGLLFKRKEKNIIG